MKIESFSLDQLVTLTMGVCGMMEDAAWSAVTGFGKDNLIKLVKYFSDELEANTEKQIDSATLKWRGFSITIEETKND